MNSVPSVIVFRALTPRDQRVRPVRRTGAFRPWWLRTLRIPRR